MTDDKVLYVCVLLAALALIAGVSVTQSFPEARCENACDDAGGVARVADGVCECK